MKQKITAPEGRAVTVTVFEPRQKPDQEEVVLDTFELKAGEERGIDYPSATAAYRMTPLGVDPAPAAPREPPPAQEPRDGYHPNVEEEIRAGKARSAELEKDDAARARAEAGGHTTGTSAARPASEPAKPAPKKTGSKKTGSKKAAARE